MHFLQHTTIALLALSTAVLTAPVPSSSSSSSSNTISIPITKRRDTSFTFANSNEVDFTKTTAHVKKIKSKYQSTLASYKANTGKAHPLEALIIDPSVEKRAPKSTKSAGAKTKNSKVDAVTTGSVSLTDVQDSLWHGAITLGSSTMQCDFDTGSADIIINKSAYTPGSSAIKTGRTFEATYGDGTTASGSVYTDSVTIAGLTTSGVSIGRASSNYISTATEGDSGICGMSYPSLSVLGSGSTPFFDALIKNKVVGKNVFTFTLASSGSSLYLGGVDPKAGTPVYTNVDTSPGYWTVSSSSINGISTSSIVDTGTSLIVAPTSFAKSFFKSVGATTFTQDGVLYGSYDCSKTPTVTYKVGSFSQKLSAATTSLGKTNSGSCILSIVGEDTGLNAVIAGDSFLENVHAVFDRSANRIGFSSQ